MTFSKYSKFSHNGFVPHRSISNYMILNDIHDVLIQVHKSFSFWIILTSNERRSELFYTLKFLCVYSKCIFPSNLFQKKKLVKNCIHHATLQQMASNDRNFSLWKTTLAQLFLLQPKDKLPFIALTEKKILLTNAPSNSFFRFFRLRNVQERILSQKSMKYLAYASNCIITVLLLLITLQIVRM